VSCSSKEILLIIRKRYGSEAKGYWGLAPVQSILDEGEEKEAKASFPSTVPSGRIYSLVETVATRLDLSRAEVNVSNSRRRRVVEARNLLGHAGGRG
jgi:hypothetical protein